MSSTKSSSINNCNKRPKGKSICIYLFICCFSVIVIGLLQMRKLKKLSVVWPQYDIVCMNRSEACFRKSTFLRMAHHANLKRMYQDGKFQNSTQRTRYQNWSDVTSNLRLYQRIDLPGTQSMKAKWDGQNWSPGPGNTAFLVSCKMWAKIYINYLIISIHQKFAKQSKYKYVM